MGVYSGPEITEDGLILHLDASNARSYDPNGRYENLFLYSQDYSDASWSKTSTTITPNAIAAPDGTITASKLVGNNGVTGRQSIYEDVTTVAGQTYTFSVFVKAGERQYCCVWFDSTDVSEGNYYGASTYLDLISGKVAAGNQSGIIRYPNGWYRVHVTATATSTTMRFNLSVGSPNNNIAGYIANGDGTSGIYIGGSQVETGSRVSEYYKTTGTAKTRGTTVNDLVESTNFTLANPSYYSYDGTSMSLDIDKTLSPTAEAGGYIEKTGTTGDLTALNYLHNDHTTEIWFKADDRDPYNSGDNTENASALVIFNGYHSGWYFQTTTYGYTIWGQTSGTNQNYALSFSDSTEGVWTQLVAVRSGTTLTLYKNGVSQTSGTITSGSDGTPSNNNIRIGTATGYAAGNYTWFSDITFSNLKMYKKALTASEIQQNYNALRGRFGI